MGPPTSDPLVERVLSRRRVLSGSAALGALGVVGSLAFTACAGDGDDSGSGDGDGDDETTRQQRVLVSMIDAKSSLAAGEPARIALGVGDDRGALVRDAPPRLTFEILDADDRPVATDLVVERHDAGLPRAYFPLAFTPEAPGFYRAVTRIDGAMADAAFEVSDEAAIVIPRPGQPFPSIVTPTAANPGGVDPICTQDPPCPLHEVELTTVLGNGPVAVLVSTPAFCQTAICGPVLELLVAARGSAPDVALIHVEVFASAAEVETESTNATLAPAVEALQLPFEPCLFLVAADATVERRLDVIYDEVELREGLASIAP